MSLVAVLSKQQLFLCMFEPRNVAAHLLQWRHIMTVQAAQKSRAIWHASCVC